MTTENPATVEELRAALQFAIAELLEAGDKLWVSHCNHPGDHGVESKDSLIAQHRRQDKEMLARWAENAANGAQEIRRVLAR